MPIRLTWTPPVLQGSGIIGYKIYKTLSPGPLVHSHTHLIQTVSGNITLYDDYVYDRRLLDSTGYIYKVTALTGDAESSFDGANTVLAQYSFEDFVHRENWDLTLLGEDILELEESWDVNIYSYTSLGNMIMSSVSSVVTTHAFLGTSGITASSGATILITKSFIASGDVLLGGSSETLLSESPSVPDAPGLGGELERLG